MTTKLATDRPVLDPTQLLGLRILASTEADRSDLAQTLAEGGSLGVKAGAKVGTKGGGTPS
ncbi:hypothetical protein ACXN5S_15475 [Pseudoroseicyclus sp. H15]